MPSRTPRGLLRRTAKRPTVGDEARRVVEAAYRQLPDPIWEQIKASTNRFVTDEHFTPTSKELRQRLRTLSTAARYFAAPFSNKQPTRISLKQLHHQLLRELQDLGVESATTIHYLQALTRSCWVLAEYSIQNPECLDALSRDERWDVWVSDLTGIAERAGLPSGARKDSDKNSGQASPFVRLVDTLQHFIPESRRRFVHSLDGLATGINRGRTNWKRMQEELMAGRE
ncbi:hypothetical protein JQ615_15785 [Bradyrhizobium jicamae]|uniref:Integrase n=1 Tax=Bradyrhizobium jicamae TaxID=280332 RepID=A0ABS5FJC8_9BRAD|nr:hypothetical protein [Bradyrhizobium jicamae]MBR0796857.1 hypothetical protein [Bradyrhizobium jicamae]